MSDENARSLAEETQERFRQDINEGTRLYRKYRRQAVISSLVSIVVGVVCLFLSRTGIDNLLLIISGAALGFAISAWSAYKQIENIPILGFLIVLNHGLGNRTMTAEELAEDRERRRMGAQQYEAPGFGAPVTGT